MNHSKSKKIIKIIITILFIMLPIIDMLRKTSIKDIELLGFSVMELFNIVIIGIATILTLINSKKLRRDLFQLAMYTAVFLIYIILHDINILNFNSGLFGRSDINIFVETYYIFRAYYLVVLLLFVLIKNRDIFDLKYYINIIKILICIISISIVVLNIFKLSYATYTETNDTFVKYNIFDFYKSKDSPKLLSTRGWFDSANEISAVLLMLLPINIFMIFKENKKSNYFIYIIQFLAMIILGTRVSSLGAIMISIAAIIINIFARIIKKSKVKYGLIICAIICSGYFLISPVGTYLLDYKAPKYEGNDTHNEELRQIENDNDVAEYISNHLYAFRINKYFPTIYPIKDDIPFWVDIALRDRSLNNDSRILKSTIINRIQERNNNKYDKYLGMGYTMNFIDLERDYIYQYYIFGLCGIILIVPQLFILVKAALLFLIKFKKIDLVYALLLLMAPTVGFTVAYFAGHVFGWTTPSYVLVLTLAVLNLYITSIKGRKKYG